MKISGTAALRTLRLFTVVAVTGAVSSARADDPPPAVDVRAALDIHVKLRSEQGEVVARCTGPCTLRLLPGSYQIETGHSHRHMDLSEEALVLRPGDRRQVHVRYESSWAAPVVVIGLVTATALLIVGLGWMGVDWVQRQFFDQPRVAPGIQIVTAAGGGLALASVALGATFGLGKFTVRISGPEDPGGS